MKTQPDQKQHQQTPNNQKQHTSKHKAKQDNQTNQNKPTNKLNKLNKKPNNKKTQQSQ